MPFYFLENLGSVGLVKDIPPEDLADGIWSQAKNVRFTGAQVASGTGFGRFLDLSEKVDELKGVYGIPQGAENAWYGVGKFEGEGVVCRFDPSRITPLEDVTLTDYTAAAGRLSGGSFGSEIIFASGKENKVYALSGLMGTELKYDADTDLSDRLAFNCVRPWKSHLWGLGVTVVGEGGVDYVPAGYYPKMLWISDAAEPGYVPGSWEASNPATLSRNYITPFVEHSGALVDLIPLRNYGVVYQENATHLVEYTGVFPQLISINTVFPTLGALSQNCVVAVEGQHVVMTENDVVVHNGVTVQSLLANKLREWLFAQISPMQYKNSFLVHNKLDKEVLVCYVPKSTLKIQQAVVWNYEANTFSIRDFPEPVVSSGEGRLYSSGGFFVNDRRQTALAAESGKVYCLGLAGGAKVYHEDGGEVVSTPQPCEVERIGFALRGEGIEAHSRTLITEIWPEIDSKKFAGEGSDFVLGVSEEDTLDLGSGDELLLYNYAVVQNGGTMNIWVGGSLFQKSPMRWKGPFQFKVGEQDFIPVLVEGMRHGVRVEWVDGEQVSFSRIGIRFEPIGRF